MMKIQVVNPILGISQQRAELVGVEFNITQLSLHSDPLLPAALVLLACAGVQPHGENIR